METERPRDRPYICVSFTASPEITVTVTQLWYLGHTWMQPTSLVAPMFLGAHLDSWVTSEDEFQLCLCNTEVWKLHGRAGIWKPLKDYEMQNCSESWSVWKQLFCFQPLFFWVKNKQKIMLEIELLMILKSHLCWWQTWHGGGSVHTCSLLIFWPTG